MPSQITKCKSRAAVVVWIASPPSLFCLLRFGNSIMTLASTAQLVRVVPAADIAIVVTLTELV